MNKSVIDSIVKPYRTRGESKYMVEEIYFSEACKDNITEKPSNTTTIINPQNAWFDNGKYRFQLPALWYQSTCNNKAIGLRSIKLINDPVAFKVNIVIYSTQSPLVPIYETNFVRQHRYGSSFMEIISQFVADLIRDVQTNGTVRAGGTPHQQRADGHRGADRQVHLYIGIEDGCQRGRSLATD